MTVNDRLKEFKPLKSADCFTTFRNDPLRSAESSKRLLLDWESELDPEPFSSLREECET